MHILDAKTFPWDSPNKTLFADLSAKYNITFVAGADREGDVSTQAGIHNMGRMPEAKFYEELARGRLVVGVGSPTISPTPYDALCRKSTVVRCLTGQRLIRIDVTSRCSFLEPALEMG